MNTNHSNVTTTTHLRTLRQLMPNRALGFGEALQRAELQACRLLELAGVDDGPVDESIITEQPRVRVETGFGLGESGRSSWQRGAWRIELNALEPLGRRRFTLAHEYKHVLDAPYEQTVYQRLRSPGEHHPQVEQVCDYFAACLLMPKKLVKRAWGKGMRETTALARYFEVSPQAMHVRLQTLGLTERAPRCRTATHLIGQRRGAGSSNRAPARPRREYWRLASRLEAGVSP